jgi:hypothetical protein
MLNRFLTFITSSLSALRLDDSFQLFIQFQGIFCVVYILKVESVFQLGKPDRVL